MSARLSLEGDAERIPEGPELGGDGICVSHPRCPQTGDQPFNRPEPIATPAERTHHLLEEWRVVVCRSPRTMT
jgi:hypothetical protein